MIAILLWLLTACGTGGLEPNNQIVQLGLVQLNELIALQLNPTAQPPSFEINHLAIALTNPLAIQDLPTYQVRGTYDLTIRLPTQQVTQKQNYFEIYLQRQKEGKTWRLLLPHFIGNRTPTWLTYSLSQGRK